MSLSAASFGLPTYQEFPVHCLIVSSLIFIFRNQIIALIKTICCLGVLIVFAVLCFKVMGFINYLIPLGAWWLVLISVSLVLLAILPLLIGVIRATIKVVKFFYIIFKDIYFEITGSASSNDFTKEEVKQATIDPNDPYVILGVSKNASQAEIKRAYYEKIKINHPDKVASLDPEFQVFATERTKTIQSAYEAIRV